MTDSLRRKQKNIQTGEIEKNIFTIDFREIFTV